VTTDEPSEEGRSLGSSTARVLVGWRKDDTYPKFVEELKAIRAEGLSRIKEGIRGALDLLNAYRMQIGIDNYGQGRNPWFCEPAIVLVLSDGGVAIEDASTPIDKQVASVLHSDGSKGSGMELTKERFRWDQRVMSFVLKIGGIAGMTAPAPAQGEGLLRAICERTGGRIHVVTSLKALLGTMESLAVKGIHPAVTVRWEMLSSVDAPRNKSADATISGMLAVRSKNGFWPIPEASLAGADVMVTGIPMPLQPRRARPRIIVVNTECQPRIPDGFPYDRYDIEPCSATSVLLSRPHVCWRCYVPNSLGDGRLGEPFGFLSALPGGHVTLTLLPYNFPRLWDLLDKLVMLPNGQANHLWNHDFLEYMRRVPFYYVRPLRQALQRFPGSTNIGIPENLDPGLPHGINSYLNKLKNQARQDNERAEMEWESRKGQQQKAKGDSKASPTEAYTTPEVGPSFRRWLKPNTADDAEATVEAAPEDEDEGDDLTWFAPSKATAETDTKADDTMKLNLNAFDTGRTNLLRHLAQLQQACHHARAGAACITDKDAKFRLPIEKMGLYHEAIARKEVIRDPLLDDAENRAMLRPTFGNPFARLGSRGASTDEAQDEAGVLVEGLPTDKRSP